MQFVSALTVLFFALIEVENFCHHYLYTFHVNIPVTKQIEVEKETVSA